MGDIVRLPTADWTDDLFCEVAAAEEGYESLSYLERKEAYAIYKYLYQRYKRNVTNYIRMLFNDLDMDAEQLRYWVINYPEDVINLHAWTLYRSDIS